jgi:hypothetical protein
MSFMHFSTQAHSVSSRRRRLNLLRRNVAIPALVILDERRITTCLEKRPEVGARLDIGEPVIVMQTKDVAGGGLIVEASRGEASADA